MRDFDQILLEQEGPLLVPIEGNLRLLLTEPNNIFYINLATNANAVGSKEP